MRIAKESVNISYEEFLKSDAWAKLRAIALARAEHRCQICNSPRSLQVHHRTYKAELGYENIADLTVLCDRCHSGAHKTLKIGIRIPKTETPVLTTEIVKIYPYLVTLINGVSKTCQLTEQKAELLAKSGKITYIKQLDEKVVKKKARTLKKIKKQERMRKQRCQAET